MIKIQESGMTFGPFEPSRFFAIEKEIQQQKLSSMGVSSVEFVLKQDDAVIFLEAKSSIPRENNEFFCELLKKYEHSLVVFVNALLGRNALSEALPESLSCTENFSQSIKLFLIIKPVPDRFLSDLTYKLRSNLIELRTLWGIRFENIFVLNEAHAIKHGLAVCE